MNAHSAIYLNESGGRTRDPDYFRSRLIEKFAEFEEWAISLIRAAGQDHRRYHLLGQKFEALRDLALADAVLFKNPPKVVSLLDELKSFLELRAALAHRRLRLEATEGSAKLLVLEDAAANPALPWQTRITLRDSEFQIVLKTLSDLTNRLRQQAPVDS